MELELELEAEIDKEEAARESGESYYDVGDVSGPAKGGSAAFSTRSPKEGVEAFLRAKEAAATPDPRAYAATSAWLRVQSRAPGGDSSFRDASTRFGASATPSPGPAPLGTASVSDEAPLTA